MKLTILGSGSSVPHKLRSASAYWLETKKGSLLLDFAPSAIQRIAQENLDWANLDAIWISHFHLDHFGGLAPFLFATKYAPETQNRKKPLRIFGEKGLKKLIKAIDSAGNFNLLKQPFPVEIIEVKPETKFEILPEIEAIALSTPHSDESMAIRITDAGEKSFVYTSDTGYVNLLGNFAKGADLFLLECSFFKNKPTEKHLEFAEAIHLIRFALPKRAILTHLYPEWDKIDFAQELSNSSPMCDVIQAYDGLSIDI